MKKGGCFASDSLTSVQGPGFFLNFEGISWDPVFLHSATLARGKPNAGVSRTCKVISCHVNMVL